MQRMPVWMDVDTGVDDAMALLNAFQLEQLNIIGISTLSGNVPLSCTFKNTRNVVALAKKDIKVYKGADRPWIKPYVDASHFHGKDGLGGVILPESEAPEETQHAWDALYQAAKKYQGELKIVAVGPLTNIATTIVKYPDFTDLVSEICIMGGAIIGGNHQPWSEFNIEVDPHAAQCVFKSGIPIVMFGLDVTMKAYLTDADIEEIASLNKPVTDLVKKANQIGLDFNESIGRGRIVHMHDSCPVLYLVHPEIFTGKKANVWVETRGFSSVGKTVSDIYSLFDSKSKEKNILVILDVDREKMVDIVVETLKEY